MENLKMLKIFENFDFFFKKKILTRIFRLAISEISSRLGQES